MLAGGVNLVEIDLLRGGRRIAALPGGGAGFARPCLASVRRAATPLKAEVYPITLRERLPIVAIPLRQTDADVNLNLQSVIDQCWLKGGYDDIDYASPPDPPLAPEDAQWPVELLKQDRDGGA